MPRAARVVAVGIPHHVTQRGNRGQEVFFTAEDRQHYLIWLAHYATRHGLKVWAYCLMPTHVHLVVVPGTTRSIAGALGPLHTRHAQHINARQGHQGHLWQGRYHSCSLDGAHAAEAIRYVERNPVRAGLVAAAEAYPWSSAAPHCGLRTDPVLSGDMPLTGAISNWSLWLSEKEDAQTLELLRRRTMKGLPCGSDDFVVEIEAAVGRMLSESG